MEQPSTIFGLLPRSVLIIVVLLFAGLLFQWRASALRKRSEAANDGVFKPLFLIVTALAILAVFSFWTAVLIRDIVVTPVCIVLGTFVGFAAFTLSRSRITVTEEAVEYFDGWRKRRRVPRSQIVSAEVRHPGAILVVRCENAEDNFTVPLIAYSRAGLLAALLQRSAMRV